MNNCNFREGVQFHCKLNEINAALQDNKWVDSNLSGRTKDCRIIRILKAFAGFIFGINMYSHIKTHNVALSLFNYCKNNQGQLDEKSKYTVLSILTTLSS